MIYAVVIFAATGLHPTMFRSAATFPMLDACRAHLAAETPGLERARAVTQAQLGRPVRMVARCVQEGQDA
jgi:hypothetical protein